MALPNREPLRRIRISGCGLVAVLGTALCGAGCSFDLSSMTPGSTKEAAPQTTALPDVPAESGGTATKEAQLHAGRGQILAQSGKTAEALAEFNTALALDPYHVAAFYQRGLLYQSDRQYQLAIADFSAANGLTPQQADPLLGRALCYLAVGKNREAANDLDEASQASPQNARIWIARGTAYEKLGDKAKAADSYSRALLLRPKDDEARGGLARVDSQGLTGQVPIRPD